jgi:hypothetical protein
VQGVVLNAASGEPLARALVSIEGDAETGALTDGEGRFEILDVPIGPQIFSILKPGFHDDAEGNQPSASHNVLVATEMPELRFRLHPDNVIYGQIILSTGDPALGIHLKLLRKEVSDGRAIWQVASNGSTDNDGHYRFSGLSEGEYVLASEPALETEEVNPQIQSGSGARIERFGYAAVFYPQARDFSAAEKIHLGNGDRFQANLTLTLEPLHTVTAVATLPHGHTQLPAEAAMNALVLDPTGKPLPYTAAYDPATRTIQATLPDGEYAFLLLSSNKIAPLFNMVKDHRGVSAPKPLAGSVGFSLTGHPLGGLLLPLAEQPSNTAHLTVLHANATSAGAPPWTNPTVLSATETESLANAGSLPSISFNSPLLQPGLNLLDNSLPGNYWFHANHMGGNLCLQSLTAGGADLAREAVHVGFNGALPPIDLVLRDDCATLTLSLPRDSLALLPGEEPAYTVYVVPAFDSVANIPPSTLRASSGGTAKLEGLTPGDYRVYTFDHPIQLEYRNPAALSALPISGQPITLEPGAAAHLTVEVPKP